MNSRIESAPVSNIMEKIEIFLISTIPVPKLPRKLKIEVKCLAKGWKVPRFPILQQNKIVSQTFSHVFDRPPSVFPESIFLASKFELADEGSPLRDDSWPSFPRLGLEWVATLSERPFLGKRRTGYDLEHADILRTHRLRVSYMGVIRELPPDLNLDADLEALIYMSKAEPSCLKAGSFKIRYDEITGFFEIRCFETHVDQPVLKVAFRCAELRSSYIRHQNEYPYPTFHSGRCNRATATIVMDADFIVDFDNPGLAVYAYATAIHSNSQPDRDEGPLNLLNTVIGSVDLWVEAYRNVDIVPPEKDLRQWMKPLITLKEWADPIFTLLFKPLASYFYPQGLGVAPGSQAQPATFGSYNSAQVEVIWKAGFRLFDRLEHLGPLLQQVQISRNIASLRSFWESEEVFDFRNFRLCSYDIHKMVFYASYHPDSLEKLRIFLEPGLARFRTNQLQQVYLQSSTSKPNLPEKFGEEIFETVVQPLVQGPEEPDSLIYVEWMRANQMTNFSLNSSIPPTSNHDNSGRSLFDEYSQGVMFQGSLILVFYKRSYEYHSLETCIIDSSGSCIHQSIPWRYPFSYTHPGDDDSFFSPSDVEGLLKSQDKRFGVWSQGRLVEVVHIQDSQLSVTCLDFGPCLRAKGSPPRLYHQLVDCLPADSNQHGAISHNHLWTVGFDYVSALVRGNTSGNPLLLVCPVGEEGHTTVQQIDLSIYLPKIRILALSAFGRFPGSHLLPTDYFYTGNVIAATDSRTVFVLILEPTLESSPARSEDSMKQFWILCFKQERGKTEVRYHSTYTGLINRTFGGTDGSTELEEPYPLVTKIVHTGNRDFLLASVGKRPIMVFTTVRRRLLKIIVTCYQLPNLPGKLSYLRGLSTPYLNVLSILQCKDPTTGERTLRYFTYKFSY